MADRIIRDELWQSIRWLDLPTDTHRLVYVSLIPVADDFGNLEGGARRLYRWMLAFTQVKSELDSIKVMSDLADADLVRRYEVDGRELWHLPRFKPHRVYLVRKMPRSPWDQERELGKNQRVETRGLAKDQALTKNMSATSQSDVCDVAQGVGVGVGVGVGEVQKQIQGRGRAARSPFVVPDWIPKEPWEAWVEARRQAKHPPTDYALRLAVRKLQNLKEQGESPEQVLMQSAFNNWSDFYPPKEAK